MYIVLFPFKVKKLQHTIRQARLSCFLKLKLNFSGFI